MSNLILAALVVLVTLVLVMLLILIRGTKAQITILEQKLNDQSANQELERQLGRTLDQSLGGLGQRLQESLARQSAETAQNLGHLREKLGVMDQAQQQFKDLGQHVIDLKSVLDNRQARGAIGELQLANLVQQVLPANLYQLQTKLSNGKQPDCLLILPNPPGPMVVDAKFPLEGYRAWLDDPEKGLGRFSGDIKKHIDDIADRYIIAGETADFALMYIPAEAVYAEIYASVPKMVDYGFKKKVFLVSPTTLMATLTTIRGIVRDVELHKNAAQVQKMVGTVAEDVARLQERVENLQKHFGQAEKDITLISTSTGKIIAQADKIAAVDMTQDVPKQ